MTVIPTREQVPQILRPPTLGSLSRPGASAAAPGLGGRDVVRILRKRMWMILIFLVASVAIAYFGTLAWRTYWPFYTAEAFVEVTLPRQQAFGGQSMYPTEIAERYTIQAARLISRENVLEEALKNPDVGNTSWYQKSPQDAPRRLEKALAITPVVKTQLVRISMTGRVPKEAADIVNAVARAAVEEAVATLVRDRQNELDTLDRQLRGLSDRLTQTRKESGSLMSDASVPALQGRRDALSIQMGSLIPELTKLSVAKAQAEQNLKLTREQSDQGMLGGSAEIQQALDMDGTLRGLQVAEANLAIELDSLVSKFGPKHLSVQRLESRLASIRKQVKDRTDDVVRQQTAAVISYRELQLAAITAQLLKVREDYLAVENQARDLQQRLTKLTELEVTIKDMEESARKLEGRRQELQYLTNIEPPARLRSAAYIPRYISLPKYGVTMPLVGALGLVLGIGLALLLEFIDTSVKTPSDISRRVDLPMLGMIPHGDDVAEEIPDLRLTFMTNPNSLVSEAFRQVRTCLQFSGPASERRSLLVTSPLPEDGRTTVALNLAAASARSGKKTLVVDANFRQPAIRALFPQAPEAGLSSALVGQSRWQDLVVKIEDNLCVMSSGTLPPNPAELLGSEPMRQFIAEASAEYDQVIFDGAPCLVVTDSPVLSTLVDGVVLAVRAGANTYGIVQRARDTLNRVGARILGVVLNGVRVTAGGYLRKHYETFYAYHTQGRTELPSK